MSPDDVKSDIKYRIIPIILKKIASFENVSNDKVILKEFEINGLNESIGFLLTICFNLKLTVEIDSIVKNIFIFIKVFQYYVECEIQYFLIICFFHSKENSREQRWLQI